MPPLDSRALSKLTLANNYALFPKEEDGMLALYPRPDAKLTSNMAQEVGIYIMHLLSEAKIPFKCVKFGTKAPIVFIDFDGDAEAMKNTERFLAAHLRERAALGRAN